MAEHTVDHLGRSAQISLDDFDGLALVELRLPEAVKGHAGRAERVAQLMRDEPEMLRALPLYLEIALPHVLGNRVSDSRVDPLHDNGLPGRIDHNPRFVHDVENALVKDAVLADDLG